MNQAKLEVVKQEMARVNVDMDYTVHGILQARILEWVAFPCSRGSSQPKDQTQVSRIADNSLPATREAQITIQLCSFHTLAR